MVAEGAGQKGGGVTNPPEKSSFGDESAEKFEKHGIFGKDKVNKTVSP